jgi:hypothetical protein
LDSGCVACSSGNTALSRERTENQKSRTNGLTPKAPIFDREEKENAAREQHFLHITPD